MIRKALVMQVDPDKHEEYCRRHNPIWEELQAVLIAHGVHNYSIFLHRKPANCLRMSRLKTNLAGKVSQIPRPVRNGGCTCAILCLPTRTIAPVLKN